MIGVAGSPGGSVRAASAGRAVPEAAVLTGITALGALLRFALLGQHSLWYDETFSALVVRSSWHGWFQLIAADTHPPLYYLLLRLWTLAAGTGEAALRIPSAVFGTAMIPVTWALARRVVPATTGLLAALFVAVAPIGVMMSQDARMYALLALLATWSTVALDRAAETGRPAAWAGYAVLITLLVYTHYLGLLIVAAHGLWMMLYRRRRAAAWCACAVAAALAYVPWLPVAYGQFVHAPFLGWYPQALYLSVADLLGLLAFGGSLFGAATMFTPSLLTAPERIVLLAPFAIVLWRGIASLGGDRRALVVLPPAAVLAVMLGVSLARPYPVFVPRWFTFLLPFSAVLAAQGVADIAAHVRAPRGLVAAAVSAALLLYGLPAFGAFYFDPAARPERWRDVAASLARQVRPGDLVVDATPDAATALGYYATDPRLAGTLLPADATPEWFRREAAGHPTVWLIVRAQSESAGETARLDALVKGFQIASREDDGGARVYELRPPTR